ncbi:universal stress protein [Variovorax rhizosphaerae]|uniref:Universal stress protein n=1 Tax=Variovorax rhizosphaerae TaxID=1836200 RepID=A0ABU8WT23_9BURK
MYEHILVPLDGTETSQRGLDEAIRLAGLTKGRLRLFHAVGDMAMAHAMDAYEDHGGHWVEAMRAYGTKLLEDASETARVAGVQSESVLHSSFTGRMAELVAAQASEWPADIVVLGTHGRHGAKRLLLGSGAEAVLRTSPVPVLLVRDAPSSTAAA